MADIQSNIQVNIDTSNALASIKSLQKQISVFHTQMAKGGAAASLASANLQQNLVNSLNATGKFSAEMRTIKTATESFTTALEKNKLSMREYYRYAGASTKTFGRLFRSEFDTVNKVARERVKDLQTQYIKMGRDASGALKAVAIRPLALDMQNLGTQTAIAAQKQQLLNQLLKQGSTNLLNFGKNTQWAGRQLMVGFTIPLMYLGTAASKTFMKLEEQAIRFRRVYGEMFTTQQETNSMLKDIQLLAKEFTKYGVAVENTMRMAADAAAQGKMGADLIAQVNQATRLAVLGGVEQEQALETTISLTNAFGVAADKLSGKINFLNAVENQTVTSIEDLTTAIPKAGPVIQQLGGSVEDLAFFLTAMKEGGINASEGANALKSGLASLINPTNKASKMLAGFGININGLVEANKGNVKGIVVDFARELDRLDPLTRARAIEQLFGKFQFARLSTLFKNVIAEGTQASRVLKLTNATTEELAILSEREMKRIEDSPMYKFKKVIEDIKVTLAPIGESFLKAITPVIEFVSKILDKFNGLSEGAKNFVVILTTVLAGIGPVALMTFGLLANGIANIIKLFTSVRGVFGRAGSATTDLGAQTNYMTQEQLRAASVAASLDQVHNKLTQSFTSEANAVNLLVQAYQRAVTAQQAFMPGIGGFVPGKGPKKFNRGTGKVQFFARGTDTVPSMLTPGEAVIPAGPAQHPTNKPFIKHMIAGGVVGKYATGTSSVQMNTLAKGYKNATIYLPESINTAMGSTTGQGAALKDVTGYLRGAGQAAVAPLMAVLAKEMGLRLNDPKYSNEWRLIGNKFVTNAVTALNSSGKKFIKDSDFEEIVVPAMKRAASKVSIAGKQVGSAFNNAVNEIRTIGHVGAVSGTQGGVGRTNLPRSYRSQRIQAQTYASTENPKYFKKVARRSKSRDRIVTSFQTLNPALKQWEVATMSHITKSVTDTVENILKRVQPYLGDQSAKIFRGMQKAVVHGVKTQARVASPSKETEKVGKQIAQGAIVGMSSNIDGAKAAGAKVGTVLADSATVAAQKAFADKTSRMVSVSGVGVDKIKAAQAKLAGLSPTEQEALIKNHNRRLSPISEKASQSKNVLYGSGNVSSTEKSIRRQLKKQEKLLMLQEKNLYKQQQTTGLVAGGASAGQGGGGGTGGRFLGRFRRQPDPNGTPRGRMGMGGVGMAASGILMAASMVPGKVGETAQKLMMPVMALTMLIPMLTSPIGALVVTLGLMAGAVIKLRMDFDKAQDSAIKLHNSLGTTRDAMRDLSKFAGTVTAGEIMDRRRKNAVGILGAKPGKTTFGESYVKSDSGREVLKQTLESIKQDGVSKTSKSLSNQLVSSILAGAITADQAKSIALNLGQKSGNYGLGFAVTAQINKLIGPNGENLEKDPLKIRVALINEKQQTNKNLFSTMQQQSSGLNLGMGALNPKAAIGGGALTGAAAGAIIGTSIAGPLIGTAVGALVGGTAAYFASKKGQQKVANLSGAYVANQKGQVEQQKEMLDSLDLYYQKKIRELEVQGKIAEAVKLQKKYEQDRTDLTAKGTELNKSIMAQYGQTKGQVRGAMDTGINKMLTDRYKGTDQVAYLDAAKQLIGDSGLTKEQQYLIKVKMAAGELTPSQQVFLFTNFGNDKETIQRYMDALVNFSATTTDQATQVMGMFTNPDGTPNKKSQAEFFAKFSAQPNDAAAQKYVAFFAEVANTNGEFDMNAVINYYLKHPKIAENTQKILDEIDKNKGNLDLKIATTFLPPKVLGALDVDYYNKLSNDEKLVYLKEIATIVNIPDAEIISSPDFKKWQDEGAKYNGVSYSDKSIGEQVAAYRKFQPWKVSESSIATSAANTNGSPPGNNGKGKTSPLDDLTKKLRDVRKLQIKVTEGWNASVKALNNLFSGNKAIQGFNGLEQNLRRVGAGQNFIEFVIGMDPKKFEAQKNKLFQFDNKGNILALKQDAQSIQKALNSIVLGEFQSELEKQNVELSNQNAALAKLSQLGVPVANAYELVADKTLAATIATAKNEAGLKRVIERYGELTEAQKKQQAIQNVKTDIAAFSEDALQNERIKQNYSVEDGFAITMDANLKDLEQQMTKAQALLKERIKNGADRKLIASAQDQVNKLTSDFNTRLNQLKSTIEYMQRVFDDGFSKAMEWFDAQETQIDIQFQINTLDDRNIIESAQDKIAEIEYGIDDWQAGLKGIEEQEKLINDEYDAKINALDEIQKLNDRISSQQKSQLTLADALSSGDIGAAAKIAQDMRSQAAQNAIDDQKTALTQAKDNLLANVRNSLGYTRLQIESQIKTLQDEIFKIQEEELEPAQERVRLEDARKREAIQALEILGKTKLEWLEVKSGIDLAGTSSLSYLAAMQAALGVVGGIKKHWEDLNGKTYTSYYKVITIDEGAKEISNFEEAKKIAVNAAEEPAPTAEEQAAIDAANAANAAIAAGQEKVAAELATAITAANKANAQKLITKLAQKAAKSKSATVKQQAQWTAQTYGWASRGAQAGAQGGSKVPAAPKLGSGWLLQRVGKESSGGLVPKHFATGGFARGTDTVPAMLTPGEFVVRRYAVNEFGTDNLKAINNGTYQPGSVYNYDLTVNVKSDANPDQIANVVIGKIRQVDSMKIRGNRL